MDKRILVTALVSTIAGGVVGGAVTYLTVKKTFAERMQHEIDEVKQAYADKFEGKRVVNVYGSMPGDAELSDVVGGNISPEELADAKKFAEKLMYSTVSKEDEPVSDDEHIINIYDRQEVPEGEELESPLLIGYDREALREARKPYLISSTEFYTTETEWDKLSITYYEDDDVLVDENDKPIDNTEYLIGEKHLDFFGIRSQDPNIVFVRNSNISSDIEITRNLGSYTEIILGVKRPSDKVGSRRMRPGDDE